MELPYNEYVWFSPRFAMNYLTNLMRKYTPDVVLRSPHYKKEKEAWIMGVALFGVIKLTGGRWWLQVPTEDPPDMKAMTLTPDHDKNLNIMNYREVEIMQITKHTNGTIVEEILRKLNGKSYPKEWALVVYLNRKMFIEDMRKISQELKDAQPKVADIWVVASTSPEANRYILFSLYPDVQPVEYDIDEEARNLEIGDSIDLQPNHKGTSMTLIRNVRRTKFIP